jgi:predicted outer membrane repeat protein
MAFKAELTDSVINTALATTPTVEVDETNTLTSVVDAVNGIPVTLVFHGGTSGITGTLTETTASGVATFSGLEVNTAGTGYYFTVSQEVINGKTEPALTATSSSFAVTDLTPTVTGISPATGSSAGGTIVVITGTNFTSTSTVAFGGVAATSVTFNSATQITATSPAGSAGPVDVTVTVNAADGPSAASASDTFTYTGIPTTLTASTLSASYTYGAAPTQFDFTLSPAAKDATSNDFAALVDGNTNNIKSIVYASRPGTASVMLLTPFTVGSSHSVRLTFNGSARYAASGSATTNQFIVTAGGFVVNTITDDTPSLATANGLTNCPANSTATGAGSCTLRDALAASAAVGGGNITFDATVFTASGLARNLTANTIYLENPALNLPANTTVTGLTGSVNGVSTNLITVNGNARDSVFTVASGVTGAGIANLTITNGKSYGGGILNQGTLTVTNSTFSGNSSPNGAGGGIYNNSGTLMVSNSTFSSNTAITDGGGIFNYKGTLTVSNSTFADNTANIGGGGIFNDSTLTVTNSTFSGNSATSDGGGIYIARGTLMLANNLIPDAISGRYTDNGGNVTSSANLSELGSYGGATQTLIPLPGSAAICAGTAANATAAGLTTDQRGFARTNTTYPGYASTACVDAGAVQTNYALSFTSEPPSSAYVNTSFGAQVTLAENGAPFADGADSIAIPIAWTAGSATALAAASTNDAIGVATSGVALYTGLYSAAAVNNTLTATLILNPAIPSNTPAIQATSSAVNITSKTTTTSASPASVTYNPAAQNVTLKATVTAAGAVDQGTVTFTVLNGSTPVGAATTSRTVSSGAASVSYALPAGTAAGVYTIQAVYNPAGPFTASSDNTQSLTVGPATATINVTPYSVTYDGSAHTATVTATGVGGVAIPSTGFTLSGTTHTAAGTYATDAWSFSDSTGNYAPASGTVSDKISTAVLTLAANNATKVYGAADPALTYNAIGLIGADTLTGALTRAAGESVGSYAINQGTLTAGANYSLSYTGANFAITAAALTVTANAQSKVYGAADPALTYNATGLIGADTLIGALTRAAGENVGSYAINQGTLTAGANYSLGYTGANFAITAAALTVTPKNVSKMYGSTATLSDYTTTGLLNSDSVSSVALSSSGAAAAAAVGSYAIAAASATGTGLSNYTISYGAGQLTVNTASLTVAAANATRIYGTANPSLSGSITGAVNSDSFTASYTTSATALSDVGSYAIVPAVTGSDLSDYATSLINGTLSVTQAGSTTTLAAKTGTPSVTGESVTLTANVVSTTSGTPTGTITFYGNGTPLCASTLDTTGAASCIATLALGSSNVLTASYGGDTDFAASTSNGISITTVLLDFTLAAPSTTVQTVIPGHAASYKFSITPNYGSYAGTVVFAASGLPAGATVTFSPASIAANSGAQTVTMTIQTAEAAARNSDAGRKWAPLALALLFLPLLGTKKIRRQGRRFSRWLCLLLLLGGMAASATLIGCGGAYFAQAPNDYTITVTATAGSVQHRFNVKLNVQ